ncbi:MAG: GAF domain-containing protein [Chloroflexi bacterium]|nr:GAF domain-containing protein [Chloroflexota bacterium]
MSWWRRLLGAPNGTVGTVGTTAGVAPPPTIEERLAFVQRLLDTAQATANAEPSATTADVLDRVITGITAAFGVKHACVHFVREEAVQAGTRMHGMQSCPVAAGPESLVPHLAGLEKSAMERALTLGQPVQISQLSREDIHDLAEVAGFEDGIIVPIAYQGDAFAWINVYAPNQRRFDEIELGLLRTVGGVLYGAIKKEAFVGAVQRIRSTLERHFSPRVVDKLISDPESFAEQKSERLDVTVLFSDIRGFTALSEKLEPDIVAQMVSEHLEAMAEVVFAYDGIVDKYIGDSVMAVFGSPFPQDDHPQRAVAAALAMIERQRELQQAWGERVMSPLAIGVGVNTGIAIVGDVGVSRREFTHLGDTVNLASRLKDVAAPWQILINETTYERAKDVLDAQPVAPLHVKGKQEPVTAYEVSRYRGDRSALLATDSAQPPAVPAGA